MRYSGASVQKLDEEWGPGERGSEALEEGIVGGVLEDVGSIKEEVELDEVRHVGKSAG